MLQLLKNNDLKLGMITNGFDRFQMNNIEALGIKEYFDAILISENEGLRKPDPKIFERALKKLNVMAEQTIFVGDHPIHDVAASRAVGMQGWWKEDRVVKKVACDYVVRDLLDIHHCLYGLLRLVLRGSSGGSSSVSLASCRGRWTRINAVGESRRAST